MKWSAQLALMAVFMAGFSSGGRAQSGAAKYDPATRQRSSAGRDGSLDLVLARINPMNSDYGRCLSEGRRALLDETVQNGYFWSNVIALVSLASLVLIITHQHRVQTRREWVTAELLVQFEHALVRARAQLSVASRNNNELANELALARESAGRCTPRSPEPAEHGVPFPAKTRATTPNTTPLTIPAVNPVTCAGGQSPAAANGNQPADQIRLFTPDVDLIMKVNSLEQQLAHSQRDNNALRRRIADGDRRLELARQRNRQVKEA